MTKKEELKEQIKALDREYREKQRQIKTSQEYINLEKERKALEKENKKLEEKEEEIKSDITDKFLDGGKYPSYSSSNFYGDKNIRQEVLNSIKRSLGIKNISLLKGKDIEKITQKLIDREESSNEELKKTKNKRYKTEERIEKIEREQEKLSDGTKEIYDKKWDLERELQRIEEKEAKIKELKNPKKVAYAKRWEKKEEVEKKLKQNFDEIVENIRIGVIKEKIVNNLEDNGEEKD